MLAQLPTVVDVAKLHANKTAKIKRNLKADQTARGKMFPVNVLSVLDGAWDWEITGDLEGHRRYP